MQTTALYKTLGLALCAAFISACSSTGDVEEGTSSEATATETEAEATQAVDTAAVDGESLEAEAAAAQAALLEQTVFYFDFDESTIKSESKAALMAHAAYLAANGSAQVVLEGHADERGTVEYNLALGERRANAVQRFLIVNGASRGQLETVSYGEEKPAVMGSSESAWAQNRRVELVFE